MAQHQSMGSRHSGLRRGHTGVAMISASEAPARLRPLSTRLSLREYLRELRARREYLRAVPINELRAEHFDTVLGNLWFLLTPIVQTGIYMLIFGVLLNVDRGVSNYPLYLVIGILTFRLFGDAMSSGARSMRRNETLMRTLYFPRAIIPLAASIENFLRFLPGVAVMIILALATGETPTWRWLLLPPIFFIAFVFVTGTGLTTARLGHAIPDLANIIPHVTRLAFYSSGVLYDPTRFTDNEVALAFFDINPLYQLLSLTRWALMNEPVTSWFWLAAPAYALVSFLAGFIYFWRGELRYGSQR